MLASTTRTSHRDRLIAISIAMALHGVIGWGLVRQMRSAPDPAPRIELQAQWIQALPARAEPSLPVGPAPRESAPPAPVVKADPAAPSPSPSPQPASPTAPRSPGVAGGRPLSAVYIAQASRWAAERALGPAPVASAFDLYVAPTAAQERFRMRDALTPADVVAIIGRTFGGGGEHPCVSNRRDIAAYATGRDARALALAVDFERRSCRP